MKSRLLGFGAICFVVYSAYSHANEDVPIPIQIEDVAQPDAVFRAEPLQPLVPEQAQERFVDRNGNLLPEKSPHQRVLKPSAAQQSMDASRIRVENAPAESVVTVDPGPKAFTAKPVDVHLGPQNVEYVNGGHKFTLNPETGMYTKSTPVINPTLSEAGVARSAAVKSVMAMPNFVATQQKFSVLCAPMNTSALCPNKNMNRPLSQEELDMLTLAQLKADQQKMRSLAPITE